MTSAAAPAERADELIRLAAALRSVVERFVATSAPVEVFAGVSAELERIAAELAAYPQAHLYGVSEASTAGDPLAPLEYSPLLGRCNPLAPPMHINLVDGRIVGTVRFTAAYEGPPGCVHGGYVAAAFDELLGVTQSLGGSPGMTGRLIVHYRNPTPLYTELRLEGTLEDVSGRKTRCAGRMWAGDTLTAEAEGLFIAVDFEKLMNLREARDRQR